MRCVMKIVAYNLPTLYILDIGTCTTEFTVEELIELNRQGEKFDNINITKNGVVRVRDAKEIRLSVRKLDKIYNIVSKANTNNPYDILNNCMDKNKGVSGIDSEPLYLYISYLTSLRIRQLGGLEVLSNIKNSITELEGVNNESLAIGLLMIKYSGLNDIHRVQSIEFIRGVYKMYLKSIEKSGNTRERIRITS